MVLSSAAEHRLCRKVAGNLPLPPGALSCQDAAGREEGAGKGCGARAGWECLIPVPHSRPGFPSGIPAWLLLRQQGSSARGSGFALEWGAQDVSSGRAGSAVLLT